MSEKSDLERIADALEQIEATLRNMYGTMSDTTRKEE